MTTSAQRAVTFAVADVVPASKPLAEGSSRAALAALLSGQFPAGQRGSAESIVFCSADARRLVQCPRNGFLGSLLLAFVEHRPITLSPDMLWLLLCQGLAAHISTDPERHRSRFVAHRGKLLIEVRDDRLTPGAGYNRWAHVIDEFSMRVRDHIGSETHDLLAPHFSTTGRDEQVAAAVALLDVVQHYFELCAHTLSGIPTVTLEGTLEDWEVLERRADGLAAFDLEWWIGPMRPILRQFTAARRGEVDEAFWRSIYRFGGHSGEAPTVTGWIAAFWPYLTDAFGTKRRNWLLMEGGDPLARLLEGQWQPPEEATDLSIGAFPNGLSLAPFAWQYLSKTIPMEFIAGFLGARQDPDTLALRPDIGWAVRRAR